MKTDYQTYCGDVELPDQDDSREQVQRPPTDLFGYRMTGQTFALKGPYGALNYVARVCGTQGNEAIPVTLPDGTEVQVSTISTYLDDDYVGKEKRVVDLYLNLSRDGMVPIAFGDDEEQTIPVQTVVKVRAWIDEEKCFSESQRTDWQFTLLPQEPSEKEQKISISVSEAHRDTTGTPHWFAKAGDLIREELASEDHQSGDVHYLKHLIPMSKLSGQYGLKGLQLAGRLASEIDDGDHGLDGRISAWLQAMSLAGTEAALSRA